VVTVMLPSEEPGLSMVAASVAASVVASVAASVVASVAEGVSDEALVHGLAGAAVLAGGDITLTGKDPMDPFMGPPMLDLIPQAPRMS
jgi:hypothetical protein